MAKYFFFLWAGSVLCLFKAVIRSSNFYTFHLCRTSSIYSIKMTSNLLEKNTISLIVMIPHCECTFNRCWYHELIRTEQKFSSSSSPVQNGRQEETGRAEAEKERTKAIIEKKKRNEWQRTLRWSDERKRCLLLVIVCSYSRSNKSNEEKRAENKTGYNGTGSSCTWMKSFLFTYLKKRKKEKGERKTFESTMSGTFTGTDCSLMTCLWLIADI